MELEASGEFAVAEIVDDQLGQTLPSYRSLPVRDSAGLALADDEALVVASDVDAGGIAAALDRVLPQDRIHLMFPQAVDGATAPSRTREDMRPAVCPPSRLFPERIRL